jgi:hypothetical protein
LSPKQKEKCRIALFQSQQWQRFKKWRWWMTRWMNEWIFTVPRAFPMIHSYSTATCTYVLHVREQMWRLHCYWTMCM